jgi:hypothetical protein
MDEMGLNRAGVAGLGGAISAALMLMFTFTFMAEVVVERRNPQVKVRREHTSVAAPPRESWWAVSIPSTTTK